MDWEDDLAMDGLMLMVMLQHIQASQSQLCTRMRVPDSTPALLLARRYLQSQQEYGDSESEMSQSESEDPSETDTDTEPESESDSDLRSGQEDLEVRDEDSNLGSDLKGQDVPSAAGSNKRCHWSPSQCMSSTVQKPAAR